MSSDVLTETLAAIAERIDGILERGPAWSADYLRAVLRDLRDLRDQARAALVDDDAKTVDLNVDFGPVEYPPL